jgi:hypothetical protein
MEQMSIFNFLDEKDTTLEDLFKESENQNYYGVFNGECEDDCKCKDEDYEFEFSENFYRNRRIYLGEDLENIPLFISSLSNEYSFIVEIDEFKNISIIPVHKEYDEASIEIIPWD